MQTIAGQDIPADLVIYATGYDRNYDYLAKDVLKALHQTDEGIPLFRDTIPTDVQVSIVSVCMFTPRPPVAPCGLQKPGTPSQRATQCKQSKIL